MAVPDQTVVIERGRITSVETGGRAPAGAEVVDGSGHYLIPGLWDMHVHLRSPLASTLLMPQFVANGVSGVLLGGRFVDRAALDTLLAKVEADIAGLSR